MLSTSSPIYATGGEPEKILVYSEFIGVRLVKLEQIRRVMSQKRAFPGGVLL